MQSYNRKISMLFVQTDDQSFEDKIRSVSGITTADLTTDTRGHYRSHMLSKQSALVTGMFMQNVDMVELISFRIYFVLLNYSIRCYDYVLKAIFTLTGLNYFTPILTSFFLHNCIHSIIPHQ